MVMALEKLQAHEICQTLGHRITGSGAVPLSSLHFKALTGTAIVVGRRVAYNEQATCSSSHLTA